MGNLVIFLKFFKSFCPGTGRDRGVCPGTFAPALVPGQRDTGTRKFFCPGTKGQRDVPSLGNTSTYLFTCKIDVLKNFLRRETGREVFIQGKTQFQKFKKCCYFRA